MTRDDTGLGRRQTSMIRRLQHVAPIAPSFRSRHHWHPALEPACLAILHFQNGHVQPYTCTADQPISSMMLRAAVIGALVCLALGANVLPISKPLAGLSVSFSEHLKSDEICKICIQEAVVMCVLYKPAFFLAPLCSQSDTFIRPLIRQHKRDFERRPPRH